MTASSSALRGRIPGGSIRRRREGRVPGEYKSRAGLAAVAVGLFVLFSIRHDTWLDSTNLVNIALANSAALIAATGTMALLISGHVDISIGSMYGLASVVCAEVVVKTQSVPLAVLAGLVAGLLLGTLNGVLVRRLSLNPIIVTLATLALFKGAAFWLSGGISVFGFPEGFLEIGRGGVGDLTYPIIVAGVVFVAVSFWLVRSATGLHVYAIGGDARAAELSGVKVGRTVVGLYAFNGLLIGLIAVLTTARVGVGDPNLGTQFEFDVLTAVILGGVAFAGGGGRPVGIFVGVLLIGILNTGLVFEGFADYFQLLAKGGLLLLALAADQYVHRRRRSLRASSSSVAVAEAEGLSAAPEGAVTASPPADGSPVLEARGVSKRFGALDALVDADLCVRPGEIVCLVGDNGAGKSTLIKVLSGALRPDTGEIRAGGEVVEFAGPGDARAAGIRTVYQDLALCPNLSVKHNFVLGREPRRRFLRLLSLRDEGEAERLSREQLARLGVRLTTHDALVKDLSGGQRQSVAIARAVDREARVAIFDEPTAALGVRQTERALGLVRSVAREGTAVILISHNVETVMAVADRVAVLRLGRVVYDGPAEHLNEVVLLQLMAGLADVEAIQDAHQAHG